MQKLIYRVKEQKLISLRQFLDSLQERGVFAVELLESENDELTIRLLVEEI